MTLSPFYFLLASTATWRVTNLIHDEHGPFDVFTRFREATADWPVIGAAVDCFYCLSLWMAIAPAALLSGSVVEFSLLWLSVSAISIFLYRLVELGRGIEDFLVLPAEDEAPIEKQEKQSPASSLQ